MPQTELWLTPLILLPGVALLIMSTSVRFGQVHDEFHVFLGHPDAHARVVAKQLVQRAMFLRDALVCLYASVGFFALGSFLGGLINLWQPQLLWIVGGLTLFGIVSVAAASVQLVRESLICIRLIRDHSESIEHSRSDA
jgi:hypothetical protein